MHKVMILYNEVEVMTLEDNYITNNDNFSKHLEIVKSNLPEIIKTHKEVIELLNNNDYNHYLVALKLERDLKAKYKMKSVDVIKTFLTPTKEGSKSCLQNNVPCVTIGNVLYEYKIESDVSFQLVPFKIETITI